MCKKKPANVFLMYPRIQEKTPKTTTASQKVLADSLKLSNKLKLLSPKAQVDFSPLPVIKMDQYRVWYNFKENIKRAVFHKF